MCTGMVFNRVDLGKPAEPLGTLDKVTRSCLGRVVEGGV